MRGFAVAAGGWDEEDARATELHLVGADPTPEPPPVVDLASRRRRRDAGGWLDGGIILAW